MFFIFIEKKSFSRLIISFQLLNHSLHIYKNHFLSHNIYASNFVKLVISSWVLYTDALHHRFSIIVFKNREALIKRRDWVS